MKVNLGCGQSYLEGWVNVDGDPSVRADIYADAFEFLQQYGAEVGELYMGHFLEHLLPASAVALLHLVRERLPSGAMVSAVVPDMRAIFNAYDAGEITNDELNDRFVYSYEQPSHHAWCYDESTLTRVFREAGFSDVESIDPLSWPPVIWKEGPESRWQCGVRAIVPESVDVRPPADRSIVHSYPGELSPPDELPVSTDEVLLQRITQLRAQLEAERGRTVRRESPKPRTLLDAATTAALFKERAREYASDRLPEGSRGRDLARLGLLIARDTRDYVRKVRQHWRTWGATDGGAPYWMWSLHHAVPGHVLVRQREHAEATPNPLSIWCVVLGGDDERAVRSTLKSLARQSWTHWQASVVGEGESDDPRISFVGTVGSVAGDVNRLLRDVESRDFVLFLEAGDRLTPDCLFAIADVANRDPMIDLVTWDDDLIDPNGRRSDPRFRPAWSPEMLLSAGYLGRSFAVRTRRFQFAGLFRDGLGDAAWWDLVLRCGLEPDRVERIPRILAHVTRRPEADASASVAIVTEHLERHGRRASVSHSGGGVRLAWHVEELPHVTVIVPTRHNRTMLEGCFPGLRATDYPSFDVVVVDNGPRSAENEAWYEANSSGLELHVEWWDRPFNYSAVNNHAAAIARGSVLVFLNDDTELVDPSWLRELASWAVQEEIGVVGLQLIGPGGEIQHGGVVLGLNGFADHLFQGMQPHSDSLLGSTDWYRNCLAVTAACLAVRRDLFDEIGGFDERFELCGSDVALGLDAMISGRRNVCLPFNGVRHLESVTRGSDVPTADFFASYWRYQRWVYAGDPFFSPNLSLGSREPWLRREHEKTAPERMSVPLGRRLKVFRMQSDAAEASMLAGSFRATDADARSVRALHDEHRSLEAPRTVTWFLPDLDSPFYGGVNTALRIADHLARAHGVDNQFAFWAAPNEQFFRSAIAAAFPALSDAPIAFHDASREALDLLPPTDAAVATLWTTAYSVAQLSNAKRKFYLIQDFEPMFYPAGTLYALAEESYRLGLYGLCNTDNMLRIYRERYGGAGMAFMPAVDTSVFHAEGRQFTRTTDDIATVFVYARPGHWRNCWELASIALEELKVKLGDRVRIVTAGSWAHPEDLGSGIEHLGLLDYRETGALYRKCDVGVALTVSEHPSYLPLELMACGVPVVAFDNPAGYWVLHDHENSVLVRRTVDGLRDGLERLVLDPEFGRILMRNGLKTIAANHASWDKALSGIYEFLSDPERS
jgi:GT2 family glycosyltransferase/predicted SAM-dependent methyltransferase